MRSAKAERSPPTSTTIATWSLLTMQYRIASVKPSDVLSVAQVLSFVKSQHLEEKKNNVTGVLLQFLDPMIILFIFFSRNNYNLSDLKESPLDTEKMKFSYISERKVTNIVTDELGKVGMTQLINGNG